jgi:hypothetical protein
VLAKERYHRLIQSAAAAMPGNSRGALDLLNHQDECKPNSRLTLNFGLPYDLQFLESIATDTDNVSPRAGFT